jgi:RTX toxin RtxA
LSVLGGGNVVTWSTDGRLKAKLGGSRLNKLNRYGRGNTDLILVSLGNIVKVEVSEGNLNLMGVGVANIVTYKGKGTLNARLFGGANVITREGSGNSILYLLAGANVFIAIFGNNIQTAK